jgi:hypothetical protein
MKIFLLTHMDEIIGENSTWVRHRLRQHSYRV